MAAERGLSDALALISEQHRGKKRRSVESVFLAIWELCLDQFAKRGAVEVAAHRRWLADQACVHIETLDAAVAALEDLGLIARKRRRVSYEWNLPNLWSLAGPAELGKPDTGTKTPVPSLSPLVHDLNEGLKTARASAGTALSGPDFRWPGGPAEHPALHGLDRAARRKIEGVYETVRTRLLDAGVKRVPEGGWLAAIRDLYLSTGDFAWWLLDPSYLGRALDGFLIWRDEGGPLCRSFGWMHKYRRSGCPPPSLLFGTERGDGYDGIRGPRPITLWAYRDGAAW